MRTIRKKPPHQDFIQYRKGDDASFANLPSHLKQTLKDRLLQEQGYLCCYCMQRISSESMRMEHFRCQARYPEQQLDYENLLAACPGTIGQGPHAAEICDVRKKDQDIKYNPAADDVERLLHYKRDGTIFSEVDKQFSQELDDVLNLNCGMLMNNRAAVYKALIESIKKWTPATLRNKIAYLENADRLSEYLGLTLYILKKWLQRLEKCN